MTPLGTIPGALAAAAERYSSAVAVEDGDVRLTFAELARDAERAAAAFMALGVERGDRVAIWAPNFFEWIVAALGTSMAGAVLVPVNTRFKAQEAGYILEKSRARVLCTVDEFLSARYVDMLASAY